MKKFGKLLIALFFAGALLAQSQHRHVSHEGGLSQEHVDCTLCAWNHRVAEPSLAAVPGAMISPSGISSSVGHDVLNVPAPSFLFLQRSRAPPAL